MCCPFGDRNRWRNDGSTCSASAHDSQSALQSLLETLKCSVSLFICAFPDIELEAEDYEEAASFFNRCRAKGIQGSNTDFLICAVAARRRFGILSTDTEFARFAILLPIPRWA